MRKMSAAQDGRPMMVMILPRRAIFSCKGVLPSSPPWDLAGDEAELRRVADVGDHHLARAARDEAARIDHVHTARRTGGIRREQGGGVLFDGAQTRR